MTAQSSQRHTPDCGLCAHLAAGKMQFAGGQTIPPYCAVCDGHHYEDVPHRPPADKRICPRCRVNRRAVEHIPEALRPDRKRYAPFCEACLMAEGYERCEAVFTDWTCTYWAKITPPLSEEDKVRKLARIFE